MRLLFLMSAILMVAQTISVRAEQIPPPSQDNWIASKKYVQINDRVTMAYVEWGDTTAEPVVLVHGYSDTSRAYSTVAPLMKDRHFIAIDLRGHGNTNAPECCYHVADFAEDISDFIEVQGYHKVDLVGHSLGSLAVGVTASLHPQQVNKLVLISSAVKVNPGTTEWLYDKVHSLEFPLSADSDFIQKEWAANPGNMFNENMMVQLRKEEAAMPKQAWIGIIKNLELLDWSAAARHITAPTLIMWGDQDGLMTESDQELLKGAIPDAKFIVYEGLGHSMYWEDPMRGAKDILGFIE